jgi:hypothetical protein
VSSLGGKNKDTAFADWVSNQMTIPATLLRAYYRQRVNPRLTDASYAKLSNWMVPGHPRHACVKGSRWIRYAFTDMDVDKQLKVSGPKNGKYTLSVGGEKRTEVDASLNPASMKTADSYSYKGCYAMKSKEEGPGDTLFQGYVPGFDNTESG